MNTLKEKKSPKSILNILQKQNLSNIVFMVSKFGKYILLKNIYSFLCYFFIFSFTLSVCLIFHVLSGFQKEKALEEEPELDPDVAAMMGFGGFRSSSKK